MAQAGGENAEAKWLEGCRKGERTAQRDAYRQMLPILRGVVRRYISSEADVQDILQEAFIRIFKSMNSFDENRGSFKNWTIRIAINTAINEGKKRVKHRGVDRGDVHLPVQPDAIHNMAIEDLIKTLGGMPHEQHTVLNLHLVDGFSHKEIAEMLGITAEVSRQRLTRARKWVRERFDLSGTELVSKTQQEQ